MGDFILNRKQVSDRYLFKIVMKQINKEMSQKQLEQKLERVMFSFAEKNNKEIRTISVVKTNNQYEIKIEME